MEDCISHYNNHYNVEHTSLQMSGGISVWCHHTLAIEDVNQITTINRYSRRRVYKYLIDIIKSLNYITTLNLNTWALVKNSRQVAEQNYEFIIVKIHIS